MAIVLWLTYRLVLSPDSPYRSPVATITAMQTEPDNSAKALEAFCSLADAGQWSFGDSDWNFSTLAYESDSEAFAALTNTEYLPKTAAPADDFTASLFALIDGQGAEIQELENCRCRLVDSGLAKMALYTDANDHFLALRLLQGAEPNLQMTSIAWNAKQDDVANFIPVPLQAEIVAQRSRVSGELAANILRTSVPQWVLNSRWQAQGWTIEKDTSMAGRWVASKADQAYSLIRSEQESGEASIIVVRMH